MLFRSLSAGPLIPIDDSNQTGQGGTAGSRTVYVPAGDVPPQPVPKPRGLHGARRVPSRSDPTPRPPEGESVVTPQAEGGYGGSEPQPPPWRMSATRPQPVPWPA